VLPNRPAYPTSWNTATMGQRVARTRRSVRYSQEDRNAICSLVLEGWPPLDVANAYGMPLWLDYRHRPGAASPTYHSAIYACLETWLPRYEAEQEARRA
jgi:hypothetical protein